MLTVVERVLALARLSGGVLADAPTHALARLASVADERTCDAGEALWAPGDAADALFVVLDGEIALYSAHAARELERLGPGDVVDAAAVVRGATRETAAVAARDTLVLCVPRAELWRLLGEEAELGRALLRAVVGARRSSTAGRDSTSGRGRRLDS